MVIELSVGPNSGSNRAWGRFEITSTITPELYDTKSNYQLLVSVTKYKITNLRELLFTQNVGDISFANRGETAKRTHFSAFDLSYPMTF